ncbi:poly(A) RNA polymerase, mitochondrial [Pundamilia nyererei]|uniref:Poly(A) RNA polymerase, mitochondrial n=1 Tax=Pundamilia nyererei TaxID=303518 RepID=A0A9Y6M156_9CICH|nr:PREDICTED: poly(A) RNA polymerase, mitochondrial [Pundamilia nyererei]
MRIYASFRKAMASSFAVCRLHMRGRASLAKCLQKTDAFLHRSIGTDVVIARAEATRSDESDEKNGRKSLHTLHMERQEQAERSVLISCQSSTNEKKFLKYLSKHGEINKYFFYESYGVYAVVEFANQESVTSLLEGVAIPGGSHESAVPFKSRLLSLRNLGSVDSSNQLSGRQCQPQTTIPINELIKRLSREESIDKQISSLTEAYQLTEENSRLRFLVCSLLKDIATAYFPECTIKPFGSSVNGFGKLGCDLDMLLDLDSITGRNVKLPKSGLSLEYQMKRANSERAVTQSILSVIGECVDQFGPGCVGVQKILNARCPLVRFAHQPSGFQCDLTANNRVAMKSTELLYLYGELDPRVRSLVFTVRCWARAHGVTSSIPGAWITNFSLTVMVLFFLQKRTPPIIPTLDHLRDLAGTIQHSHSGPLRISCRPIAFWASSPMAEAPSAWQGPAAAFDTKVYTYSCCCSRMCFQPALSPSLSLQGKEQNKPEVAPLHIQNPFEASLNVSKNVNASQLDRFVALCQESAWLLQQSETSTPRGGGAGGKGAPTPWGLATLLLPSQVAGIKSRKKRRREPASERIKGLLESLKNKNQLKKS